MQAIILTIISFLLLAGGSDNIFMLDESDSSFERSDILADAEPETRYQLKYIIPGNFSSPTKTDFLLVHVHSNLSAQSLGTFKLNFAEISEKRITSGKRNFSFKGRVANIKAGDVNGDGLDDVVLHWSDSDSHEWIGVLTPNGLANDIFPPRQIPDDRQEEIALADMDGDGSLEIVVPSLRTDLSPKSAIDKIIVYFIEQDSVRQESYAIIPAPVLDLIVDDTNKDGKDEIITLRKTRDGNYNQAIWAIMRRDDGSYAERPLAKGNSITLIEAPPNGDSLYYIRIVNSAGHFFNEIVALQFSGDNFERASKCRLLPEGLVFAMAWGRFTSPDEESLAIITDEAMQSRRWLTLYTPKVDGRFRNHLMMAAHDEFYPIGQSMTSHDLNNDGIDELIYIGLGGRVFAFDTVNRSRKYLALKKGDSALLVD
jgi:hypothetical protein